MCFCILIHLDFRCQASFGPRHQKVASRQHWSRTVIRILLVHGWDNLNFVFLVGLRTHNINVIQLFFDEKPEGRSLGTADWRSVGPASHHNTSYDEAMRLA